MPLNLRLAVLIIALILAVVVIRILHKRMIPVKYSLLWGIGVIILLFLAIWPNSLIVLANLVGFQTVSNMVIGVLLVILFFNYVINCYCFCSEAKNNIISAGNFIVKK